MKTVLSFTLFTLLSLALPALPVHAADLDLDKAIKVGSGKVMVIEFTDPDCPYCRKAEEFFGKRTDVTRYVFMVPLPMHQEAAGKAQYVLSAADAAKAYRDVMSGSLDGKTPQGVTEKGKNLLEEHRRNAQKAGVNGMPTFIISGMIIEGLDMQKMQKVLPP